MKFTKDSKLPDPIPQDGIQQAIKLMETGRLYRYNFGAEFNENGNLSSLKSELASEVAQLEVEFSEYTGHKYMIAVNSCGSALFLSLKAAGVQPGAKVLTNGFTFTAVPSSIVHAGAVPIFLECNELYQVDLDDLKGKIQAHQDAKFFVLSHMRGHISDLQAIEEICHQAGVFLIEDCAHSLGSKWYDKNQKKDRLVGQYGQVACFSSQSYKLLNSGEGGFVATNDDKIAAYCILAAGCYEKLYKKHISRPFDDGLFEQMKPSVPNFSLRMNNLTAAVIRPQIKTLETKIYEYNEKYEQLANILSSAENIQLPSPPEEVYIVCDSIQFNLLNLTNKQVEKLIARTAERGVKIQIFGRLDNSRYFKNWKYSFDEVPDLPQTEKVISVACDLRISLSFDANDINLIGYIIKDVLYGLIKEETQADYKQALTDNFEGVDSVVSKYDEWVSYYDEEHKKNGWRIILNYLGYVLTSYLKSNDKILDVGCGTGWLGQELNSYNFSNLYGADISKSSLEIAEKLNVYQSLDTVTLGSEIGIEDNSFDAWVSTGVFTRNQVPINAFEELIRILKIQGLLIVVLRAEDNDFYYKKIKEYYAQNTLEEVLKEKISPLRSCNHEIVIARKIK